MICLAARDLEVDRLLALLSSIPWPEDCLLMAFTPAEARLTGFGYEEDFLRNSDQGRIFSPGGELKWRRVEGKMRVVYLGEPIVSLDLEDHTPLLQNLQPRLQSLLLWGMRTELDQEWLEQQVPHRFCYPLTGGAIPRGRLALVVEHWVDESDGLPRFSRYLKLEEIEDRYDAPR